MRVVKGNEYGEESNFRIWLEVFLKGYPYKELTFWLRYCLPDCLHRPTMEQCQL